MMKKLLILSFMALFFMPMYAQKELLLDSPVHLVGTMDASQCVKERDGKTPMALLHLSIPGLDDAYITEENNFIKGAPIRTSDGWDVWVTTKTKKNISLKIYTNGYKPFQVSATSRLESGKKYELDIKQPEVDVNAGKVYVFVNVNEPCEFRVSKDGKTMEKIMFQSDKLDTLLHLPYGRYTYSAVSRGRFEETGSLILTDQPVEQYVELRSNRAKIRVWSDKGTTLAYDGQEQVAVGDTAIAGTVYQLYEMVDSIGSTHQLSAYREDKSLGSDNKEIIVAEGENDYDMHIMGTLEITKPKNAHVSIDNSTEEDLPYKMQALGKYAVTYRQYGRESKTEYYNVGMRKNVKEGVHLKRTIAPFTFANYTYSPSAEIGIMFGKAKRWGWYCSVKTSLQWWNSVVSSKKNESNAEAMKNSLQPEEWAQYGIDPAKLEKLKPSRFSVSVGAMKSLTWWLYVYLGVGYESYKTMYENPNPKVSSQEIGNTYYKDKYVSTYNLKGLCVDGGILVRLGNTVNLTAGWTHLMGSTMVGDFNVGIGFSVHKN